MKKFVFILILSIFTKFIFCENFNYLWAEYATYFKDGIDARKKNIETAVKILDGYILYPGIEFSFIEEIINKIPEDEMGPASTIIGEKRVPGIGGGLCQVATTLYNLALLSGISIRERKNHSSPVSYVSPGIDATVSKEEGLDLKIQNPYRNPLMIKAKIINNKLQMEIYGIQSKKRDIKIMVEITGKNNEYLETITKRYVGEKEKLLFYEVISKDKYKLTVE